MMKLNKLKDWISKPRLSDENWRSKAEFFSKGIIALLAAFWLLIAGTDFIDKRTKLLSRESIPNADTKLHSYKEKFDKDNDCVVSGQYEITNIGKLAFKIDSVNFQLKKLQPLELPIGRESSSSSLLNRLANAQPIDIIDVKVNEMLGPENSLQVNYLFKIRQVQYADGSYPYYSVEARGAGGLPDSNSWLHRLAAFLGTEDTLSDFGPNDLRIDSGSQLICDEPSALTNPTS